jgi:hypothetical protein
LIESAAQITTGELVVSLIGKAHSYAYYFDSDKEKTIRRQCPLISITVPVQQFTEGHTFNTENKRYFPFEIQIPDDLPSSMVMANSLEKVTSTMYLTTKPQISLSIKYKL